MTPQIMPATAPTLSTEDRCALLDRVWSTSCRETESWRHDGIGIDLAYLAWSISTLGFVDWSHEPPLLALFREWFPADDAIWNFIEV